MLAETGKKEQSSTWTGRPPEEAIISEAKYKGRDSA